MGWTGLLHIRRPTAASLSTGTALPQATVEIWFTPDTCGAFRRRPSQDLKTDHPVDLCHLVLQGQDVVRVMKRAAEADRTLRDVHRLLCQALSLTMHLGLSLYACRLVEVGPAPPKRTCGGGLAARAYCSSS